VSSARSPVAAEQRVRCDLRDAACQPWTASLVRAPPACVLTGGYETQSLVRYHAMGMTNLGGLWGYWPLVPAIGTVMYTMNLNTINGCF